MTVFASYFIYNCLICIFCVLFLTLEAVYRKLDVFYTLDRILTGEWEETAFISSRYSEDL